MSALAWRSPPSHNSHGRIQAGLLYSMCCVVTLNDRWRIIIIIVIITS
jgi:energy-coupling factor transporter transmembrane protein EcfT